MSQERAGLLTSRAFGKSAPRWILVFVALSCVMVGVGGFYTTRLPQEQYERAAWVGHTREVMEQLARLALHISESEAAESRYRLKRDEQSVAAYENSVERAGGNLNQLHKLLADNELQHDRLLRLRQNVQAKLAAGSQTIAQLKDQQDVASTREAPADPSEVAMQSIREGIDELWRDEQALLQSRMKSWREAMTEAQFAIMVSCLVIFALIITTGLALWRLATQQQKMAETERQLGEIQRAKAERLLEIVQVQREIAGHTHNLEFAMQTMTKHTERLTRAEGSIVETVDGDEMVYRAASGLAAKHIGLRLKAEGSLSGLCVREGQVLKCDDSETDDRVDRAACRSVGLRSMVVVPLRHQDERLGVLKVLSPRVRAFDENDVATLELLAGVLSGAFSDAIGADSLRQLNEELAVANVHLEELAATDGMTGLKNHRMFQQTLTHEYQRARRYDKPLSLVLLDVDHFKKYNDSFGHPAGDAVLKRVAKLLQEKTRVIDHVARYGGEEFVVLLPETDAHGANVIAERMREAIAEAEWDLRPVTASFGVTTLTPECESAAQLVADADAALYQSKQAGRNRVTQFEPASKA